MGHQSFETTLQYAHLSQDHAKKQVMKLPFAHGVGNANTTLSFSSPRFYPGLLKRANLESWATSPVHKISPQNAK